MFISVRENQKKLISKITIESNVIIIPVIESCNLKQGICEKFDLSTESHLLFSKITI